LTPQKNQLTPILLPREEPAVTYIGASDLNDGDIMLKMKGKGFDVIETFISTVQDRHGGFKDSFYTHAGIYVGAKEMIEVTGGNEQGLLGNFMKTSLMKENKGLEYEVWACTDEKLCYHVRMFAFPFVNQGNDMGIAGHYDLKGALSSVGLSGKEEKKFGNPGGQATPYGTFQNKREPYDIWKGMESPSFFCSEFIIWLYNQTAMYLNKPPPFAISSQSCVQGLKQGLENNSKFKLTGILSTVTSIASHGI
jgi:hypothetical protein